MSDKFTINSPKQKFILSPLSKFIIIELITLFELILINEEISSEPLGAGYYIFLIEKSLKDSNQHSAKYLITSS